jgi:hypothetical protein
MSAVAFALSVVAGAGPWRAPRGTTRRTHRPPTVAIERKQQPKSPGGVSVAKVGTAGVARPPVVRPEQEEPRVFKTTPCDTTGRSHHRTTLLGATAVCVVAVGSGCDVASAREVVLEFPAFPPPGPSFGLDLGSLPHVDPLSFARFTLSNPPVAVAASIAAYLVIPKLAKVLTKFVLLPAVVVAVAVAVAENPQTAASAASVAFNSAKDHPKETSAVVVAIAALALSPYILLAALLALILSGAQVLPDVVAQRFVPEPMRQAGASVERLRTAAEPGVAKARGALGAVRSATDAAARERAQKAAKAEAEAVASETAQAARVAKREEATRGRAEQAASAIDAVQGKAAAVAAAAAAAAESASASAAEAATNAASTARCAARETNEERVQCVDEHRAERKRTEATAERLRTTERRAQADRLLAESVKRAGAIPSLRGKGPESG